MGKAYGADAGNQWAKRIGVIIDAKGVVTHYFSKVSAAAFPGEALKLL
jgi:peroxiredoxin